MLNYNHILGLLHRLCFTVFTCFFVLSFVNGSSVQDTLQFRQTISSKGQFLKIGVSGGWFAVKDFETSPLIYKGFLPGIQIGGLFHGKKTVFSMDYSFSYGKLVTRNYPGIDVNKALAYNNSLNLDFGRKINSGGSSDFYIGPRLCIIANFRNNPKFNNANFNFEGFAMFGPMLLWEKEMDLVPRQLNLGFLKWPLHNRTMKWSTSLYIPFINGVARPPYPGINDFVDGRSPTFNIHQLKIVSFNYLTCLVSTSSLSYYLQNGNRFMLSYQWYYYNYHPSTNKIRGVAGNFAFSFLFRLNKK